MTTPADARAVAQIAVDDAEARLIERTVDPATCRPLLEALRRGTEQVIAAREHGRDAHGYRRYLDEVYVRLDADPPRLESPRPPKRTLALRW